MTSTENLDLVRDFLSTAVFIDDQLSFSEAHIVESDEENGFQEVSEEDPFDTGRGDLEDEKATAPVPTSAGINAREITRGFSHEGIVCGIYKFDDEAAKDEDKKELTGTISKADLIILDWKLLVGEDIGQTATELLLDLLQRDIAGRPRLRMCVIYSDYGNAKIVPSLSEALAKVDGLNVKPAEDCSSICIETDHGALLWRIILIDKKTVDEQDLASTVVESFKALIDGFMPGVVMAAVTETRRRTFEYLFLFPKSLDRPAFDHFLTLYSNSESQARAADDFSDFVVETIHSLIGDSIKGSTPLQLASSTSRIGALLADPTVHKVERGEENRATGGRKKPVASASADAIMSYVQAEDEDARKAAFDTAFPDTSGDGWFEKPKGSVGITGVKNPDHFVLSHRTQTNRFPREIDGRVQLTFGTVLRLNDPIEDGAPDEPKDVKEQLSPRYFLCMQPACDSVRLSPGAAVRFPLIELEISSAEKKFSFVVEDGEYCFLKLVAKPSALVMAEFTVNGDTRDVRNDNAGTDTERTFTSKGEGTFVFIDQLKQSVAQEASMKLAAAFSRIGTDKFEWQRRMEP